MNDEVPLLGLEEYLPDKEIVRWSNKQGAFQLAVRGLTTDDVTYLISKYRTEVEAGVILYRKAETALVSQNQLDDMILMILREAPGLAAEVISVAADRPEISDVVRTYPFSVQASALHKVVALTLVEADGLKNLLASLKSQIEKVLPLTLRQMLTTPKQSSPSSTGVSEQTSPS